MIDTLSPLSATDMGNSKVASGAPKAESAGMDTLSRPGPGANRNGNESVNVDGGVHSTGRFQAQKAMQGETAARIRQSDAFLDVVEDKITKMDEALSDIVKRYPPYPPGSEERLKRLQEFSAFSKEIERLTFPPDPFSDSVAEATTETGDTNAAQSTLSRMEELGIPVLNVAPDEATDEEIHSALSSLGDVRGLIDQKRHALQQGAEKLLDSTGSFPDNELNLNSLDDKTAASQSEHLVPALKGTATGLTHSLKPLADLLD